MANERLAAFKKDDMFYIPNDARTGLKAVTQDVSTWMYAANLENMTARAITLLAGSELNIYTPIENDEYTVNVETYGTVETTDLTNIDLHGFAGINKMTVVGSNTCHIAISFDQRKTWWTWSTTGNTWIQILKKDVFSQGMTVATANALNAAQWGQKFARTSLDYIITVSTKEELASVTLTFPANSAPTINSISVTPSDVHNETVNFNANIKDVDGDSISYELYVNDILQTTGNIPAESSGNIVQEVSHELLNLGQNTVKFIATDEKGANVERTFTVTKSNYAPTLTGIVDNDRFSFTIQDAEGDKVRYRVLLNDEEIARLTSYQKTPISGTLKLPYNKIVFGTQNKITVEYQDNIPNSTLCSTNMFFTGYYYGILFTSPELTDPRDAHGNLKDTRFYSNSLKEIVNQLIVKNLFRGRESSTYEIHVLNRSDHTISSATIYAENANKDVVIEMSPYRSPFEPQESITFKNIKFNDYGTFYIRVSASEDFIGWFEDDINVTGTVE